MMTKSEAQEVVNAELRSRCQISGDSYVVVDDLTIETLLCWVFFYDSKRYLETGSINDALAGNGPVIVNKHDGNIEFYGSHKTVEEFISEHERKVKDKSGGQA